MVRRTYKHECLLRPIRALVGEAMRASLHLLALAVVVLGIASSACENPKPAIGVYGSPERLVVVVGACADDALVHAVELRNISQQEPVWRIESSAGSPVRVFPVGENPPGFAEVVEFSQLALPPDRYQVRVDASEPYEWESFDLDEVQLDEVLLPRRGHVSMSEMEELNSCE